MGKSTTLTIRVDQDVKDRLEKIAVSQKRSKSFLATAAIEDYLSLNEWQIDGINKGLQSLSEGKGVAHEDVMTWLNSWDTDNPLKKPNA